MNGGWIKLHRKMVDWEWYDDISTFRLFMHLLLTANYKDIRWRGMELKRGTLLTSLRRLSEDTQLSVKQVRTAIRHLESTGEVECETARQGARVYTIVTLCNYVSYQSDEEGKGTPKGTPKGTRRAHEGHTKGTAMSKEGEEGEEGKEIKNPPKSPQGESRLFDDFSSLDTPEFRKAWEDKKQHRKERRDKPYTKIGTKRLFKQFAEWGVDVAIQSIEESITNNWQGVFFPKQKNTNGQPLKVELVEPTGWQDCLRQLKEDHPEDSAIWQSNPRWRWEDIPAKVRKLITHQLKG